MVRPIIACGEARRAVEREVARAVIASRRVVAAPTRVAARAAPMRRARAGLEQALEHRARACRRRRARRARARARLARSSSAAPHCVLVTHRQPRRHRFECGVGLRIVERRQDEHVGRGEQAAHVGDGSAEAHALGDAEARGQRSIAIERAPCRRRRSHGRVAAARERRERLARRPCARSRSRRAANTIGVARDAELLAHAGARPAQAADRSRAVHGVVDHVQLRSRRAPKCGAISSRTIVELQITAFRRGSAKSRARRRACSGGTD